jgi:hypothetical protein
MKKMTFAFAALALGATVVSAQAKPPKFKASCPTGIEVRSNNQGRVRINGQDAKVKEYNANAWDASHGGVTISIGLDGGALSVMYTGKGGANGICQVTSEAASGSAGAASAGTPSKDEQACLQAVSQQTNNGDVVLLNTETSEANNTVIIGVGQQKAKWQCLVKNGKVAEVMSLTNEGAN